MQQFFIGLHHPSTACPFFVLHDLGQQPAALSNVGTGKRPRFGQREFLSRVKDPAESRPQRGIGRRRPHSGGRWTMRKGGQHQRADGALGDYETSRIPSCLIP